jgi:hypothetical protein
MSSSLLILLGLVAVVVFIVVMVNRKSSEMYGVANPTPPNFCSDNCGSCYNYAKIDACRTNCQAPSRCGCDNPDVDCYDRTLIKFCQNSPNYKKQCSGG